ncbi:MAG: endolytic transglycosylase MltG [Cytophagales bacterium]|nr:MAG: endolytic transglycosylase MltG [Cytophagales bacterium]TAF59365.1 MAG: endolytic transglycosylase MltG [Cytophagales bacterium]
MMGVFAGVCTLLVAFSFYAYQMAYTPNLLVGENNKKQGIYISNNMTFDSLVKELKSKNILHDELSFRFVSKLLKYNENVKKGYYEIEPQTPNLKAIRMLRSGAQKPVKITFNNIRVKEDLAEKIVKNTNIKAPEILKLLNDPAWTAQRGFDTTNIMAMFLPNTYEVYWTIKAEDLLKKMQDEYQKFWTSPRLNKAKSIGLTPVQVSVLASIVDAETQYSPEKARVAGVYVNRLTTNSTDGKLQADPTLVFAHRDFSLKRVLNVHKEIDSPYNTYKYAGLPPGPICLPTLSALDAVLNYEKHNYIFFCAKPDFSGQHNFAVTYADHLKNAKTYQAFLDKQGIR